MFFYHFHRFLTTAPATMHENHSNKHFLMGILWSPLYCLDPKLYNLYGSTYTIRDWIFSVINAEKCPEDEDEDDNDDDDEEDPSTYECGLAPFFPTGGPAPPSPGPSTRIIGGEELPPGAIPWIAAIYPTHGANFSKDSLFITGTLISDRHILTWSPALIGYKPENLRVRS